MNSRDDAIRAEECRQFAADLDPARLHSKLRDYVRGGLPANSMPESISKTSEPPLPSFDRDDRIVREQQRLYGAKIFEAHAALRSAMAIQTSYLVGRAAPAPEEVKPVPFCNVEGCMRDAEKHRDGYRDTCRTCRRYKSAHGEFPKQPQHVEDAA